MPAQAPGIEEAQNGLPRLARAVLRRTMGMAGTCEGRERTVDTRFHFNGESVKAVVAMEARPQKDGKDLSLRYGTAGFRDNASVLNSTCLRMGMLSVLRAVKQGGPVGIMVTASHNPGKDNGLKLADFDGGMLHASWEEYCTKLANSNDVVTRPLFLPV